MDMKKIMLGVACAVAPLSAHAFDQAAVDARVKEDVAKMIEGSAVIISAIKAQNDKHAGMDEAAIKAADDAWKAEAKGASKPTIDAVLANPVSKELKTLVEGSGGFYTEVFVMDNKGLNVGQSDVTSDFWQGDEDKFTKSYGAGDAGYFADKVDFDESTQAFSTQVSAAVKDPATGKAIGAVTFGVKAD